MAARDYIRETVAVMERSIIRAEQGRIVRFIREQATKGTADYEHKLMKLADAIERGEHEC